jgi:hypothetical protein
MAGFPQPSFSPDQIAAMQQQMQPAQSSPPAQPQPASSGGYAFTDMGSPAAAINSPAAPSAVAPGSTQDLENLAAQAPLQTAQRLQQQQQTQQQPQQQQQWSPENPHAKLANYFSDKLMQAQPQTQGGNVKRLLTNIFSGMGTYALREIGAQTPDERRQILSHNAVTYGQLADQWEQIHSLAKYHAALADQTQQNTAFNAQMQPLRLQQEQQAVTQGQQNIPTVRPSMSAADLASLGVPGDLAAQYAGHPLSEADMGAVKQMAVAGQKQLYDYGADGQGQGKGIWLVDKQYNPIKQLSPISETSRSTSLARQQMQMDLMRTQSGQTGMDIVEGRMDPSQISPRSPQYPYVLNAANQYSQQTYGQPFDFAKASSDYAYAKNPQTQNTLKMINAMVDPGGSIEIAQTAAKKLPQMNSTIANQVFNAGATQFGSAEATNFHTAMLGLADEYSKVMGGGVSSDTGRQQALDILKAAYSKGQLSGAVDIMRKDISARKTALVGNNTYLQRQYSPKAAGAAAVTQPTASSGFSWSSFPVAAAPAAAQ